MRKRFLRPRRVFLLLLLVALAVGVGWYISGSPRATLSPGGALHAVAFSPDGTILAVGGGNNDTGIGFISLWDVATHRATARWPAHSNPVYGLAFDATGTTLTSVAFIQNGAGLPTPEVKAWDRATQRELKPVGAGPGTGFPITSPTGRVIVDVAGPGHLKVSDTATAAEMLRLEADSRQVNCAAFSPDGTILATGGGDAGASGPNPIPGKNGSLRLWDVSTGRCLATYNRHWWGPILSVAFSPDGRLVASAGLDGKAMLWDVPDR